MAYNSISEIFQKISRTNDYNLKILSAFTRAMVSDEDSITIELLDSQNTIQIYTIPSFGYFKRIVNNLTLSTSSTTIGNNVINEVSQIKDLTKPNTFIVERNKVFDYFYNKSLYVTIDLSYKISSLGKAVYYEKIVLDIKETQESFWNSLLSSTSTISYDTIFDILKLNSINYYIEKDIKTLTPTISKYDSDFDILRVIKTESNPEFKDYLTVTTYSIDKIDYLENIGNGKTVPKNVLLNDTLVTKDNLNSYKILKIEKQTNGEYYITLGILNGITDLIPTDSILVIKPSLLNEKKVNINIKNNEKIILFLKNIDDNNYIMSSKFSDGIVIDVNQLETIDENGTLVKFQDYTKNLYDFNSILSNMEKVNTIPSEMGIKPDYPIIKNTNFEVNKINGHLNVTDKDALQHLIKQLIPIDSRIQVLQQLILDNNLQINLQPPIDSLLKEQYKQNISNYYIEITGLLINKNQIELSIFSYNSTFTELSTKKSKYRVRGFWSIPEPKKDTNNNFQEVVQFKIAYRYLSLSGQSNPLLKYSYYGLNGESRIGTYSEWIEYKTDIRKKVLNKLTQKFEWVNEDTESDIVNINQLDLPINPDERIEIRIKSISEAGLNETTFESDWSDTIIVDFPDVLKSEDIEIQNLFSVINDIKLTREMKTIINTTNETINSLIDRISSLNTEIITLKIRVSQLEN